MEIKPQLLCAGVVVKVDGVVEEVLGLKVDFVVKEKVVDAGVIDEDDPGVGTEVEGVGDAVVALPKGECRRLK
jgi:hypothetical protein